MGLLSNCLRKQVILKLDFTLTLYFTSTVFPFAFLPFLFHQVIAAYNVNEVNACDDGCTCGISHSLCNEIHYGCNYPCSLFQMLNSMREWDAKVQQPNSSK